MRILIIEDNADISARIYVFLKSRAIRGQFTHLLD